jgi:parallel beta-helix repeat protein
MKPMQRLLLCGALFCTANSQAQLVRNINTNATFSTIQAAIDDPGTLDGHNLQVSAGTYNEDVDVTKEVHIMGDDAGTTIVSGVPSGPSSTFQINASNVLLQGLTITRSGNNPAQWNDPTLNSAGLSIQGLLKTNVEIRDCIITGNRVGIDINNSAGHSIHNNTITVNRVGIILRNQTNNLTVAENTITDNWTVGILFLDASGGTNVPGQTSTNSNFNRNLISGNWYAEIVDRQSGGSLPTPGTTNLKSFGCNRFGTNTPVVTSANSTEPGYAALIPVVYGGSAVAPGGQPDIAGPASANIQYSLQSLITYPASPLCALSGLVTPTQDGPGLLYSSTPGLSIDANTGAINMASSASGTYLVTLSTSAGCGDPTANLTVRPTTPINPIANQSYCSNNTSNSLPITGTPGLSFTWTASGTNTGVAASGAGSFPTFNAVNNGPTPVSDIITVRASGGTGCTNLKPMVFRVTTNPSPIFLPPLPQSVCSGSASIPVTLSSTVPATTYTWINNNPTTGLSAAGAGNIPSFTARAPGPGSNTSIITVSPIAYGCPGSNNSFAITVQPSPGTFSYPQSPYCQVGTAVPAFTGSVGGIWLSPPGVIMNPATGVVNLSFSTPGFYTVNYFFPGICGILSSGPLVIKAMASVDPVPNQVYCDGFVTNPIAFTGSAASYTWTNDNTGIGLAASGSGNIPAFNTINAGPGAQLAHILVKPIGNGVTTCTNKVMGFRYQVNFCPPISHPGDHSGDGSTGRISTASAFNVSPNPARGQVTLQYTGVAAGPFMVQLVDGFGQPTGRSYTWNGSAINIDLSGVRPGAYMLRIVQQKNGAVVQKQLIKL